MRNDDTRANAASERKKSFKKFDLFSFAVWKNVQRKTPSDDETKNIAGRVLKYDSKNFHWQNKNLHLERTTSEIGKQF